MAYSADISHSILMLNRTIDYLWPGGQSVHDKVDDQTLRILEQQRPVKGRPYDYSEMQHALHVKNTARDALDTWWTRKTHGL